MSCEPAGTRDHPTVLIMAGIIKISSISSGILVLERGSFRLTCPLTMAVFATHRLTPEPQRQQNFSRCIQNYTLRSLCYLSRNIVYSMSTILLYCNHRTHPCHRFQPQPDITMAMITHVPQTKMKYLYPPNETKPHS